jgi:hypothetical protein
MLYALLQKTAAPLNLQRTVLKMNKVTGLKKAAN